MIAHPHQAPFGLVLAQLGRVFAAASGALPAVHCSASPDDPVFLPDIAELTPDQAQELRYGKGRDR